MVKVQIVEEKDAAASPYASPSSSRTSSSVSLSSVESELSVDETFFDRVAALVDIVPPTTRHKISSRISKTASFLKRGGKLAGNIVWIVTTSALLVALPLALSLEDEAKIVAQEKEMLEQQQGAQQVSMHIPTRSGFNELFLHSTYGRVVTIVDAGTLHVPTASGIKSQPTTKRPRPARVLRGGPHSHLDDSRDDCILHPYSHTLTDVLDFAYPYRTVLMYELEPYRHVSQFEVINLHTMYIYLPFPSHYDAYNGCRKIP